MNGRSIKVPSHPIGIQKALKISAKYTNTQGYKRYDTQ